MLLMEIECGYCERVRGSLVPTTRVALCLCWKGKKRGLFYTHRRRRRRRRRHPIPTLLAHSSAAPFSSVRVRCCPAATFDDVMSQPFYVTI